MAEFGRMAAGGIKVTFILILALVLTSCGSLGSGEKKGEQGLNNAVEGFNSAFRWEDYKTAAAFVDLNRKEQFWALVDKFKGKIRLVDFQIREISYAEKLLNGSAILYFQYYRTDSPSLQTVTLTQMWYFSDKEKIWKLAQSGYEGITKEKGGI